MTCCNSPSSAPEWSYRIYNPEVSQKGEHITINWDTKKYNNFFWIIIKYFSTYKYLSEIIRYELIMSIKLESQTFYYINNKLLD